MFIRFLVILCVDKFGDDLSGVAGGVEMVGVLVHFLLGALLSTVSGKNVLVVIEVVIIVFVKESLGHIDDGCGKTGICHDDNVTSDFV